MDVFYEESSVADNAKKRGKKYKIINFFSICFLALAIFTLFLILYVPLEGGFGNVVFVVMQSLFFFGIWFLLRKWKMNVNVSYDYSFVSGELRISKVINVNKRKLIARFDCAEIIQVGDSDAPSFERFRGTPGVKTVFCTSNYEAADDKFFMYIYVEYSGKKLFVLECREALLVIMLKFMKRTTLDHDYVSQEQKKK